MQRQMRALLLRINQSLSNINLMKYGITLLCLLLAGFSGISAQRQVPEDIDIEQIRKLQYAQLAISNLYVDSVDQKKLAEDAINGMLEKLDPHSSYTNAEQTKKLNEPLEGNFEGIGVQFNMLDDTLVVIQPTSRAERKGRHRGGRPYCECGRRSHCWCQDGA